MDTTELAAFNKLAQERFEAIKRKLKIETVNIGISKNKVPIKSIDEKLLNKMLDELPNVVDIQVDHPNMQRIIDEEVDLIDSTFTFIESLKLPPNLNLAIAQIISYSRTNSKTELHKSIAAITRELEIT